MLLNNRACQTTRVPKKFFEKIIPDLIRCGLIKSKRGACGGYTLARSPEQISFYDVIDAIEGAWPIRLSPQIDKKAMRKFTRDNWMTGRTSITQPR
jgi:Rrf2 family protein